MWNSWVFRVRSFCMRAPSGLWVRFYYWTHNRACLKTYRWESQVQKLNLLILQVYVVHKIYTCFKGVTKVMSVHFPWGYWHWQKRTNLIGNLKKIIISVVNLILKTLCYHFSSLGVFGWEDFLCPWCNGSWDIFKKLVGRKQMKLINLTNDLKILMAWANKLHGLDAFLVS